MLFSSVILKLSYISNLFLKDFEFFNFPLQELDRSYIRELGRSYIHNWFTFKPLPAFYSTCGWFQHGTKEIILLICNMSFTQQYKEKIFKVISDLIAGSPDTGSIDLPELSCIIKREYDYLIPVLEALIRESRISIQVNEKPRNSKSVQNEIKSQIKLLNDAFIPSNKYYEVLAIKDNQTIRIFLR